MSDLNYFCGRKNVVTSFLYTVRELVPVMPRFTTALITHSRSITHTTPNKLGLSTLRPLESVTVLGSAVKVQIFYLVDEGEAVGRGANSVASMLHHHFEHLGYGERNVLLHMDNCSGQNKNNTVIGYGMWRVMCGLHTTLEFSLMEAGHTKFSPDWHFGIWKVRWRHANVESLDDIARSVYESSRGGHNIPQLVADTEKPVVFLDWASFLKKKFKPIVGLKKFHHYRMTSDQPGIVWLREHAGDEEVQQNILKVAPEAVTAEFPNRLVASGLPAERQWYLYEEVAPYCNNSGTACPKPPVPKPKPVKCEKL